MIGSLRNTVIDCPDPQALASFYNAVLGWQVTDSDDDWVTIQPSPEQPGIAFQLAPDHVSPDWPDPTRPQQFHLDLTVADADAAEAQVLALGARKLPGAGDHFRVYADPAGHPFCLCTD